MELSNSPLRLFIKNTKKFVHLGNDMRWISQKWDMNISQTPILSGGFHPSPMAVVGIRGTSNDFTIDLFEFLNTFAEGNNLGGTNERKILWVEEKNHVFSQIVRKFDIHVGNVSIFQNGSLALEFRGSITGL